MRKPLGKNEIKRVARIWASSFLTFYLADGSEDFEGKILTKDELDAVYTEIGKIADRLIGNDVELSNLWQVVEYVIEERGS